MPYSEKLNGYWEEGYHYYMEFRDEKLTMREYRRKIVLETTVSYDAEALDRGEETEIIPADPVLSRWPSGEMAMEIRSLRYVGGELKMLRYYTIMGEKEYTLKKVDGGPFRHIRIRDEEVLSRLQGKWKERTAKRSGRPLTIQGNSRSLDSSFNISFQRSVLEFMAGILSLCRRKKQHIYIQSIITGSEAKSKRFDTKSRVIPTLFHKIRE